MRVSTVGSAAFSPIMKLTLPHQLTMETRIVA